MHSIPKPRIFISAPLDEHLSDDQLRVKKLLLDEIEKRGFTPQEFLRRGIVARKSWTFQNAIDLISECQGVLVLGLARSRWEVTDGTYLCPSEYSHFEGAIALSKGIPTLIVAERGIVNRGIVSTAGGEPISYVDLTVQKSPLSDAVFVTAFDGWLDEIEARPRVFLGYCGQARTTAVDIQQYIERDLQVSVRNYAMDFQAGGTILEEIERSARECSCGIFLFTNDDPLASPVEGVAAPRDNVVFETGYFMHAKGKQRSLCLASESKRHLSDTSSLAKILVGPTLIAAMPTRQSTRQP